MPARLPNSEKWRRAVIDAAGYGAAASGAGALAALLMRPEQAEPGIEGRPDPDAPPTQERDQAVIDGALAGLAGGALGAGAASLWMNRKAGSPEVVARVQSTRGGGGQPPAAAPPPAPKGPPGGVAVRSRSIWMAVPGWH